jgi:hypothetical protein
VTVDMPGTAYVNGVDRWGGSQANASNTAFLDGQTAIFTNPISSGQAAGTAARVFGRYG